MSVSNLHPFLTLYAMSLVSELPKSDIWDLGDGAVSPVQICCNLEYYSGMRGSPREILEEGDLRIEFGDFFSVFSTFHQLCVPVSLRNHQKWIPREIPHRYRSGEVEKQFFPAKIHEKSDKIVKIDSRTPGGAGNLLWEFPLPGYLE